MSTICKLDPRIRQRRAERRSLRVELHQQPRLTVDGQNFLLQLDRISRDHRFPAAWKEASFQSAVTRFEARPHSLHHMHTIRPVA